MEEQRTGDLIAPRRRTERLAEQLEPVESNGVPVISRLPTLDSARRRRRHVSEREATRGDSPALDQNRRTTEYRDRPYSGPEDARFAELTPAPIPDPGTKNTTTDSRRIDMATESRPSKGLIEAIKEYPWNNVLLGVSLAALLLLTIFVATRAVPGAVSPSPPTVHYHIVPPSNYTAGPGYDSTFAQAGSPNTGQPMIEPNRAPERVARREPVGQEFQTIDVESIEPPGAVMAGISELSRDVDTVAEESASYPVTQFQNLPMPPLPSAVPQAASALELPNTPEIPVSELMEPSPPTSASSGLGVRLDGNIEEFEK